MIAGWQAGEVRVLLIVRLSSLGSWAANSQILSFNSIGSFGKSVKVSLGAGGRRSSFGSCLQGAWSRDVLVPFGPVAIV